MNIIKYIPLTIILILTGFLAFYFYKEGKATELLLSLKNKELMESNLVLGRAKTEITEQKKVHKVAFEEIDKKWKDEINARKGLITSYAKLEALYKIEKKNVKTITKIVYKDRFIDKTIELPKGKIFYKDEDGTYKEVNSLEYAYSDFRIDIVGDALKQTISYKLHQKFTGQIVESKLPSGGINHYLNIFEVDDKGKQVKKLELTSFEVLRAEDLPNRMMWWNPKIDLGITAGASTLPRFQYGGDLGLSVMSYGKTENDLLWRFVRLGIGFNQDGLVLSGSPAQFNIGSVLPLISNLWLSPFAGYNLTNKTGVFGLGLHVVL